MNKIKHHVPHMKARREMLPEQKLILNELFFGPGTEKDIAAAIGRCLETARRHLKVLHEKRKARIVSWERTRSRPVAIWGLGAGANAKFRPLSATRRWKRFRDGNSLPTPSKSPFRRGQRCKVLDSHP